MSDEIPWLLRPCSNCIKPVEKGGKGRSPEEANRRASNIYCKECNRERGRKAYQERKKVNSVTGNDLVRLGEETTNLEQLLNGPPPESVEEALDLLGSINEAVLYIRTAYNSLLGIAELRAGDLKVGRPRKDADKDWEADPNLMDLRTMIATFERDGTSGVQAIPILQEILEEKGYDGPELQYRTR